jgi:hypothetical protein
VQDPESANPSFIPRLDLEDELDFNFTFVARQTTGPAPISAPSSALPLVDTNIAGLTFAYASNAKDLDTLITREFHADPNLHKNSNVQLIGDLATAGSLAVESTWTRVADGEVHAVCSSMTLVHTGLIRLHPSPSGSTNHYQSSLHPWHPQGLSFRFRRWHLACDCHHLNHITQLSATQRTYATRHHPMRIQQSSRL